MIFENVTRRTERADRTEKEIERLESEIQTALEAIQRKTPEVVAEFQRLSPEQQDRVSQAILEYMEGKYKRDLRSLLPGAVTAGIFIGGITSTFGGPGGIAGGIAAAVVTILLPLIRKGEELQARRFFDSNRQRS